MKIIDLSFTIEENMPVYPGTEGPKISEACTLKRDGFREAYLQFYSHTGTHMDAPAHMINDGKYLDDFSVEQFVGQAVVIETIGFKIEKSFLEQYKSVIESVDFLLLKTNWSNRWQSRSYFSGFPTLTEEAAKYLATFNLKGLGVDAISVDEMTSKTYPVHLALLSAPMVLIENLNLMETSNLDVFILNVLPLKTKKTDGSPVRATAVYSF